MTTLKLKLVLFFSLLFSINILSANASISFTNATLTPSPLANFYTQSEGILSFNLVESAGEAAMANHPLDPLRSNIILSIELNKLKLKNLDPSLISGSLLTLFDVNYTDGAIPSIRFSQKAVIPAFSNLIVNIPVQTTSNSRSSENNRNGFNANMHSFDGQTSTSNSNASLLSYTLDADPNISTLTVSHPTRLADNTSASTITLLLKNAAGIPFSNADANVTFSTTGDATLSNVVNNHDGTYTATITNGTAQTVTISANINNQTIAQTASVQFTQLPISTITSTLSATPATVPADNQSTSTITLQAKDPQGNAINTGGANVDFIVSGTATLSSIVDNQDGTYTTTIKNANAQTVRVFASINNVIALNTVDVVFAPKIPSLLTSTLTVNPTTLIADGTTTSTIILQLKDAQGNNITTGGETIQFNTTGDALLSAVIDNADGTYTATIKNSTAQSVEVSALINGVTATDTKTVQFTTGAPSATTSTLTQSPNEVEADGVQSSIITLQVRDIYGNLITTGGANVSFNASGNASLSNVIDNNNGTYTATITNTTAQDVIISAILNGTTVTDVANVKFTVGAASPNTSTVAASPTSLPADGATTSTITLQTKDAQGNNLTTGGANVSFNASGGSAVISNVTDNGNGTYTATVTNINAENVVITALLNGSAVTNNETITFTVGTISPVTSTLTATPLTLPADGTTTSTITLQAKDTQGNNLTTGGANIQFNTTGDATISNVIDHGDGTYTATITNTTAQSVTLSATINGVAVSATRNILFEAGAISRTHSTLTVSPNTLVADGVSISTITLQAKDAQSNNLTTGGETIQFNTTGSATLSTVIDNGDGTYTATIKNSTAETIQVSALINGLNATDTKSIQFTTGTPSATTSTLTQSPNEVEADGVQSSTITLQLKDIQGNLITTGGQNVSFNASGNASLSNVIDNNNGTYTATVTNTTAQDVVISAILNGTAITHVANVKFTVGAASPNTSTVAASPTSLPADGTTTSTITLQTKDAQSNNLTTGGASVNFTASGGSAIISNVTDNGDGTYTATVTNTSAQTVRIYSSINNVVATNTVDITFTPSIISPVTSTMNITPSSLAADGTTTATITIQAKDAQGNNLTTGGANIVLNTTGDATLSNIVDHGNGTYTATITNTTAQSVTLSATINGSVASATQTINFTVGNINPTTSTLTANPTAVSADNTTTSTITLQAKDAQGNNLSTGGATVLFQTSGNATLSNSIDHGDGTYSVTIKNNTPETVQVSAHINGTLSSNSATIEFTTLLPDYMPSMTLTGSPVLGTSGEIKVTITIEELTVNGVNTNDLRFSIVKNQNLDLSFDSTVTSNNQDWTLSDTGNLYIFTYTKGDRKFPALGESTLALAGTFTTPTASRGQFDLTASIINGSGDTNANNNNASQRIVYNSLTIDPQASTLIASPSSVNADGIATSTITLEARDSSGAQLSTGGENITFSNTGSAILSPVTDNNDGTYTATITNSVIEVVLVESTINGVAGSANVSISFTANPLQLLSTTPVDNLTTANATADLSMNLNQNVNPISGKKFKIFRTLGNIELEEIDMGTTQVTGGNTHTITINPNQHLIYGEAHYIKIDQGAVQSTGGADYSGIPDTTTWNFSVLSGSGPCGCDTLDNCDLTLGAQLNTQGVQSLNAIQNYVTNQSNPAPTAADYAAAGITGVTDNGALLATFTEIIPVTTIHTSTINRELQNRTPQEVDTPEEIQAIVDELIANRAAGIHVSSLSGSTSEAGRTATFAIKLYTQPKANVTIRLNSSDTTEGTVTPSSITLTPSNWDTPQTVTIQGVDDMLEDGDISYQIILQKAVSSDTNYHKLDPIDITVVNKDVDTQSPPRLTQTDPVNNANTVNALQNLTMTFNKDIQTVAGKKITIYKTIGDIELEAFDTTVTQVSGSGTSTLTINPNTHLAYGATHYIQIESGAIKDYSGHNYTGIQDKTTWNFSVTSNTGACGCDALDNCDLEKTAQLDETAILSLKTIQNYTTQGNQNTIAPTLADYNRVGLEGITPTNINQVNEMLTRQSFSDLKTIEAIQTLIDATIAGFIVSPISNPTAEDSRTATFTVQLTSKPKADVHLRFSSSDESEGIVTENANLTFTPRNWNQAQTVTIQGVGDTQEDGNVSYQIIPDRATSTDIHYDGKQPSSVNVINISVFALLSTTPSDDATEVDADTNLTMLFTEAIHTTKGKMFKILRKDTYAIHTELEMQASQITGDNTHTLTINPDQHLAYGIGYYVTIDAGALKDKSGNESKAIADKERWNFTIASGTGPCGCDTLDNCDLPSTQQLSLEQQESLQKIQSYVTMQSTANRPSLTDYTNLGIHGVTYSNLSSINTAIAVYTGTINTPDDIQAIVNTKQRELNAKVLLSEMSQHTKEDGTTSTFTIRLSLAPTSNVTIRLVSSDTTEGTVPSTPFTFTPENWSTPQTATVTGVADNELDGDIAYYITATATSPDSAYEDKKGYVMIINDNSDTILDSDGDSMPDDVEDHYGFDKNDASDATLDADGDGVENATEVHLDMHPLTPDDLGGKSDSERYILHVLNRLSYGMNTELLAQVNEYGIETWIEEQLTTPQTSLDPADEIQQKRDNYYLNHPYRIEVLPTVRPLHSQRQLQTVMGHFWDNHFNTYFGKHLDGPGELHEEDQFYLHALGNFKTLLMLSAKSSIMSRYLDGYTNIKGKPNENYAREVMELHTIGIDGGYTDEDIAQLARILTGWTYSFQGLYSRYNGYYRGEPRNNRIYNFYFNANNHDTGENKPFLINNGGKVIETRSGAEGVREAEEALDILAKHPKTATHICTKLAQKFISDTPDTTTISSCAQTFLANTEKENQIELVLRTLFASDAFHDTNNYHAKIKDTQEYLISLARLLELDATLYQNSRDFGYRLNAAQQGFFYKPPPTGYAEVSSAWSQTDIALRRLQAANLIINHNSYYALSLSEFFTYKKLTDEKAIISFLLPITTGGFYSGLDIQKAYDILRPNHAPFEMDESRLRELLTWLVAQSEFHIQ